MSHGGWHPGSGSGSTRPAADDDDFDSLLVNVGPGRSGKYDPKIWEETPAARAKTPFRTKTVGELKAQLSDYSEEEFRELQRRLYRAGLMPAEYYKGAPLSGYADPETVKAWETVLGIAARERQRGRTIDDILGAMEADFADTLAEFEKGGSQSGSPSLDVVETFDPQQLGLAVQETARALIGKELDEAKVGEIVNKVNQRIHARQQQVIDKSNELAATVGSGTVAMHQERDVSLEAAVEEEVRRTDPAGVAAYSGVQMFGDILGWLRGGA